MLSATACPDKSGKSRLSAVKAGFAGKTLLTFLVFIILLTTAQAQEIEATLSGDASTDGFSIKNNSGTTRFRVIGTGLVGIGAQIPIVKLDIRGTNAIMELSGSTTDREGFALQVDYANGNTSTRIFFRERDDNTFGFSFINAGTADPTFDGTAFTLLTNRLYLIRHFGSTTGNVVMTIERDNGNVGIGTVAPSHPLNVVTSGNAITGEPVWISRNSVR